MNRLQFDQRNVTSELHPAEPAGEVRLDEKVTRQSNFGRDPTRSANFNYDAHHKDQNFGDAAKEKLNNAGQAIKHTAEKIGDKAGELKDKAKEKIQDGVDTIKGN